MKQFLLILFLCVVIFTRAFWMYHARIPLSPEQIQHWLVIKGVIHRIPLNVSRGIRFQFLTDHHQLLLLTWYQQPPALHVGDRWLLTVKLKPPVGMHNPGGFDYERFLKTQGIVGTGYINAFKKNNYLGVDPHYLIARTRERTSNMISQLVQENNLRDTKASAVSAFISALSVGVRDGLSLNDWEILQKTGTNHLIAIAGLHIGFIVALSYFLIKKMWVCIPRAALWVPASRVAECGALILAVFYSVLSGFALPAQRATLMLFFFLMATMLCREVSSIKRFIFAAFCVLLIDPFSLFNATFWLSFTSIFMLLWLMRGRLRQENKLFSWAKMQWAVILGILPWSIYFFQQISFISFFANSLAIPWVGFILLPVIFIATGLSLLHLSNLSTLFFMFSVKLTVPLWWFLSRCAAFPWASYQIGAASLVCVLSGMIGAFFLLAPRGFPMKTLGCFGLLPLFFYHLPAPAKNHFMLSVIDVGQGLSVLVRTAHHVMLYDAGAHIPEGFDVGEAIVSPYLRTLGIRTIDRLEISHADNDHSGGMHAIIQNFHVKEIATSAPDILLQAKQWAHGKVHTCVEGDRWEWDGIQFETLSPPNNAVYTGNNSSCVIKVKSISKSALLTGDIENETEKILVRRYGDALKSDILVAPHHGSKTSSSKSFLNTVNPKIVIISAGKYNRYHLPSSSVIEDYHVMHLKIKCTAESGIASETF